MEDIFEYYKKLYEPLLYSREYVKSKIDNKIQYLNTIHYANIKQPNEMNNIQIRRNNLNIYDSKGDKFTVVIKLGEEILNELEGIEAQLTNVNVNLQLPQNPSRITSAMKYITIYVYII